VESLGALLPFILIALVFWLLIVRPQRRRQQSIAATQAALQVGTEVMLGSGIYGRIASVDDEETTILVEVAPGTVLKVAKQAVVRTIEPEGDGLPPAERREDVGGSSDEPGGGLDDHPGPDEPRP
jgi:preprotein translocase subunit YajC